MRSGPVRADLRICRSLTASALEGRARTIHGIGSGMFKLAGTVITYGVVAAVIFGSLRYLLFEGGIV
ncbi:MAG: SpoVA/SpoVAEb family sporulation membrane protein [Merdibacter sp.]